MPNIKRRGIRVPPTTSELEAMQAVSDSLIQGAIAVGATFDQADDDWWPVWVVLTPTQATMLMPESMETDADKVAITQYVADYARRVGATAIGHVHSIWHVLGSGDRYEEVQAHMRRFGTTAGLAGREEGVLVAVYTASSYRAWIAPITRHENSPPTLGSFQIDFESDGKSDLEGRMVEPLRESLRRYG
jgi:hypothetical protein